MARDRDDDITDRRRRRDEDDAPRRRRRDEDEDDGFPQPDREYLRGVAGSQRGIIFCILGQLALLPLQFVLGSLPPESELAARIALVSIYLAVAITAAVFLFQLALKVYSTGVGVLLGILTLVPVVGLIVLMVINQKATAILKNAGVRVGLLGANSADLR